jgi:XTP/dITP diphosphohydrolase
MHKKAEFAAIFTAERGRAGEHVSLCTPSDAGIAFDPVEDGASFAENALIKARALFAIVGEPVVADDSGLCVDALGGRPGIHSARYGGGKLDAAGRNALLLEELKDAAERSARFVCAMAFVYGKERFVVVGESLEGEIISRKEDAAGKGGFGYDPVFFLPQRGCTLAELSAEEKNKVSHRGRAARLAAPVIGRLMREGSLYQPRSF